MVNKTVSGYVLTKTEVIDGIRKTTDGKFSYIAIEALFTELHIILLSFETPAPYGMGTNVKIFPAEIDGPRVQLKAQLFGTEAPEIAENTKVYMIGMQEVK